MCIGHAMEERTKLKGQETERPAPKKRGPKPKAKKGDTPSALPRRVPEDAGHTLTLTLSKELQEKLLQYAVVKMFEDAAEADRDPRL